MGGQLWQYIFVVLFLVYQVKGFEINELESHSGAYHMHEPHDGYEGGADLESDRVVSEPVGLEDRPHFCYYRPEAGLCYAYIPRYYFDFKSKSCRRFIYGGCGGNQNSFRTRSLCVQICKPYV